MANYSLKQTFVQFSKKILAWVKSNCVNNLVSTSKNLPLSANQGRVLKEGQDAINQSLGCSYDGLDVVYQSNSDISKGLYTLTSDGFVQCIAKTASTSGSPFIRLEINNTIVFEGYAPTKTYSYLWSPLFRVKKGDTIKYTLISNTSDSNKELRIYRH